MTARKTVSQKIYFRTLREYRKWAKQTGRNIVDLLNIALIFALSHRPEVERENTKMAVPDGPSSPYHEDEHVGSLGWGQEQ